MSFNVSNEFITGRLSDNNEIKLATENIESELILFYSTNSHTSLTKVIDILFKIQLNLRCILNKKCGTPTININTIETMMYDILLKYYKSWSDGVLIYRDIINDINGVKVTKRFRTELLYAMEKFKEFESIKLFSLQAIHNLNAKINDTRVTS
jgi:hypothetical protein